MDARRAWTRSAFLLFALLCWIPSLYLLAQALLGGEAGSLAPLAELADPRMVGLLENSLIIGFGTAIASTLVAVPLAFVLERTNVPLRGLFTFLAVAPIVVPPYVTGIAYTELLAELGKSQALADAGIPVPSLAGFPGCIFLLTISLMPIALLLAMKGLRGVDGAAEAAGRLCRSPVAVFFRVSLRMALPSIVAGFLFVFVFAVSDFSIPDFLSFAYPGGPIRQVFATEVFFQFSKEGSAEKAAVAALPLVALVGIAAFLLLRLEGRGDDAVRGQVREPAPTVPLGRAAKGLCALFAALVVGIAAVLPIVQLVRWTLRPGPDGDRLHGLTQAFREAGPDIGRSILLSASAAVLMAFLGFFLAYGIERSARRRASRGLAALCLLPVAFPAVMVGIGEIRFWNAPWNPLAEWVYPSIVLIALTYAGRFLPFAVLTLRSTLRATDPAQEDAARLSGRGATAVFFRVLLPAAGAGLLTAFAVGFLLCMRELDTVVLLPAGSDTLPHRVYSMVHTSRDTIIGAMCLVLIAAASLPLILIRFVLARRLDVL